MSDKTRTVTVESLAAALNEVTPTLAPSWRWHTPDGTAHGGHAGFATAIFAALPVATAGPDLREYARHKPGCASYMPSDSNCSCGLAAAQG